MLVRTLLSEGVVRYYFPAVAKHTSTRPRSGAGIIFLFLLVGAAPARATTDETPNSGVWDPPVVTPSGQPSRISEAPSTTFVITSDEIRKMGATSLPEILRRVPGLDVRQLSATDGQIGPRGFAYDHSDRVLLLIDGRTAYLDYSGGTAYEMLPISLADIDRIEIVMGPGGAVYGNKALLGVINIITRSAEDFPWNEARLDASTPGDFRAGVRSGAVSGPWRFRASGIARRLTLFEKPRAGIDPGRDQMAGGGTLHLGYNPAPNQSVSLESGVMSGRTTIMPTGSTLVPFDSTLAYARIVGRQRLGGPGSPKGDLNFMAGWNGGWIKSNDFVVPGKPFAVQFNTAYGELNHTLRFRAFDLPMEGRWGTEVRANTLSSNITENEDALLNVAGYGGNTVILGKWRLGAGLRIDRQTLTRTNISPRLSVVFSPKSGHQLRLALNTGYNNPYAVENFAKLDLPNAPLRGNRHLNSERIAYGELGYAGTLTDWLRVFTNGFVYRMTDWITLDARNSTVDPNTMTVTEIPYGNNDAIIGMGGETGVDVVTPAVNAYAHYAHVYIRGKEAYPYNVENFGSPTHKVGIGFRLNLPASMFLSFDGQYFDNASVARIPADTSALPPGQIYVPQPLDAFITTYARLGWTSPTGLQISIAGSNLTDNDTPHFPGAEATRLRILATVGFFQ